MSEPTAAPIAPSRPGTLRLGVLSWQVPLRAGAVSLVGLLLLAVLVAVDLSHGDFQIPLSEVVSTLLGGGDTGQRFIVLHLRLPQTLVAVLVGLALGLAGAMTQTFARNPLASPDILGVNQGAAVGAVAVIVMTGSTGNDGGLPSGLLQQVGVPMAAFGGGLGSAVLLYALSWRRGIDGQRLILIGIGLSFVLTALTSYLLVHARIQDAVSAQVWLNGSLNARGWDQAWPLIWTLLALVPLALLLAHPLNAQQLGDDPARGLGVRLQTTELLTLLTAVGLAAVAVAAVGPLSFVALVVPQIALRLVGGSRPPMVASMVWGACLVVTSDVVTRVLLTSVPAGLVTSAVGAPYLIWLLLRSNRRIST
ncbi:FecCD family ABC transporter permease [Nocardioides acrostichi]|uniref:Iron ABC transporter permease n=1 Tax=Nocardioides acrostichi TaxID=2784339 RepID=A0A930UV72_9ACTN|nr:iron chelate uptake ABC transporter family permease subunit [Nocardioides acrostichi]MBF4161458.1 iron ABC transporter permease [Nocardioides acrostichi]